MEKDTIGFLVILLMSCSGGYTGLFESVTDYSISGHFQKTPSGIKVYTNGQEVDLLGIDRKTAELEECLELSIHRDWFVVYIPDDWYISECSGEQLIPSEVNPELCRAKGLVISLECEWIKSPTEGCPCPCNVRATIQENGRVDAVITAPNLKMYKMPLARIVLYPQYVFPDWAHCI